MPARYCIECGNLVTTAFCPSCGAVQPDPTQQPDNIPTQAWSTPLTSDQEPNQQPWHQFEQSSWIPQDQGQQTSGQAPPGGVPLLPEQPTLYGPPPQQGTPASMASPAHFGPGAAVGSSSTGSFRPGSSGTGEFMGVSSWQSAAQPPRGTRSNKANWILGGLAAAAVVAVLVAIAFIIIKSNSADDIATPDNNAVPITVDATPTSTGEPPTVTTNGTAANSNAEPTSSRSAQPPVQTVTETTVGTTESVASSAPSTEISSEASVTSAPAENPRGGPDREITCNSGYIVQVASALTDADFEARVAQLRAAGQLPADVAVATTAGSCQIFTTQTNTVVLYAGPFPDKYAACTARLGAAPDSFIKGTTPETAAEYVSCLCPAAIDTLPAISSLNETGVWVGELQRVLANKLKYKIPDLNGLWGTFSQSTIDAVKSFQTDQALPVTGQVDAATWQKLQAAQC